MRKEAWRYRGLLLLGLLVAFALRLYRLGDENIWWDEGLSVLAARKSLWGATLWTASDVHPPLYFWLLWLWRQVAGESWFALRFVTVMEGMLTVALLAPLGRRASGRRSVGLLALWLLALSRFHIWWCQQMRMYVLAGMTSLLALTFLLGWLRRPESRREALGLLLATTAALYTVYSNVQLLLIENLTFLWALLVRRGRAQRLALLRRWVLLQLGSLLLFLPWLALALPRMRSWSVVEKPATLAFVAELYAVLVTTGLSTFVGHYLPLALPAFLLAGWSIVHLWRAHPRHRLPLVMLVQGIIVPPLVIWLLTQPRGFFYTPRVEARYLLPFAPLFDVVLAWALVALHRLRPLAAKAATAAVMTLSLALLPGYYGGRYLRDDYLTMSRLVWAYGRPDDLVLLVSGDRYALFLPDYDAPQAPDDRPPVFLMPGEAPLTADEVAATVEPLLAGHERLWLAEVEAALQDPNGEVRRFLEGQRATALDFRFGYNRLTLFGEREEEPTVTHPPCCARPQAIAPSLQLVGTEVATREFRPADHVRFLLFLRSDRAQALRARLVGEDGRIVGETRFTLEARRGVVLRMTDFLITPYTPRGRYHLRLEAEDGSVEVGEVRVTRGVESRPPVRVERIEHPMEVRFGESIRLLGYDLRGARGDRIRPGTMLHLRLYWETEAPIAEDLHVFTHLVGTAYNPRTEGPLWAQDDQVPLEGAYPTYDWLPDLPLADEYELELPPDLPPGDYWLTVGLYREDGERLPVEGSAPSPDERSALLAVLHVEP